MIVTSQGHNRHVKKVDIVEYVLSRAKFRGIRRIFQLMPAHIPNRLAKNDRRTVKEAIATLCKASKYLLKNTSRIFLSLDCDVVFAPIYFRFTIFNRFDYLPEIPQSFF